MPRWNGARSTALPSARSSAPCALPRRTLTEPSLRARHVADLALGVYAAPAYLARVGTPAHPQALESDPHRIVGYRGARTGAPPAYAMQRGSEQVRVHGRHVLSVDDGLSL